MRRRSFLSTLGVGMGVALCPGAGRTLADSAIPKRFVVFYSPNDPLGPELITPAGTGDRALSALMPAMSSLERHRDRLLMVGNLRMPHPSQNHSAIGRLLTARATGGPSGHEGDVWGKGPSLDHVISTHLTGEAPLVLGVRTGPRDPLNRLSYRAADQPIDAFDDPSAAFVSTFGALLPDLEERAALQARMRRRGSILDASREQLGITRSTLGVDDRRKLGAHLEALRAIETRVTRDAAGMFTCSTDPLVLDGGFDHTAPLWATRTAEHQMDVMTRALACGATRVGTMQIGTSGDTFGSHVVAPEMGIDLGDGVSEHNDIVHDIDTTDPARRARRVDLERIYFDLFARFLDRLAAVPEADGSSLLDNTVVMWCKSLGTGAHRAEPLPFILAGGRCLGLTNGRYLDRSGQSINSLYASITNLFGMELSTFGDPTWSGVDPYWADPAWTSAGPMNLVG